MIMMNKKNIAATIHISAELFNISIDYIRKNNEIVSFGQLMRLIIAKYFKYDGILKYGKVVGSSIKYSDEFGYNLNKSSVMSKELYMKLVCFTNTFKPHVSSSNFLCILLALFLKYANDKVIFYHFDDRYGINGSLEMK